MIGQVPQRGGRTSFQLSGISDAFSEAFLVHQLLEVMVVFNRSGGYYLA